MTGWLHANLSVIRLLDEGDTISTGLDFYLDYASRFGVVKLPMSRMYSFEVLRELVRPYKTRMDFLKGHPSAYVAATRDRVLDRLFSDHENNGYAAIRAKNGTWNNPKKIENVAHTCTSKSEFQSKYSGAYEAAKRFGDEFFEKLHCTWSARSQRVQGISTT